MVVSGHIPRPQNPFRIFHCEPLEDLWPVRPMKNFQSNLFILQAEKLKFKEIKPPI